MQELVSDNLSVLYLLRHLPTLMIRDVKEVRAMTDILRFQFT